MPRPFHEHVTKQLMAAGIDCQVERYERTTLGASVSAYFFAAPGLAATAPIVVYAHGTGNDALYPQLSLFRSLLGRGLRVFTFDLDGHGRHSTTELDLSTIDSCLANACTFVQTRFPAAALHLVGHSLGGALALAFAATAPAALNVASLSLIATPVYLKLSGGAALTELRSLRNPSLRRQLNLYGFFHLLPAVAKFKRRHYPIRLKAGTPAALKNPGFYYLATVAKLFDELDLLTCTSQVQLPTLLCYGGHDRIALPAHGRLLAQNLRQAHYIRLEHETHFTTLFAPALEEELCQWILACRHSSPPHHAKPR